LNDFLFANLEMFYRCVVGVLVLCVGLAVGDCENEKRLATDKFDNILRDTGKLDYFYVPDCDGQFWKPLQRDSNQSRWCVDEVTGEMTSLTSKELTSCYGCLAKRLKIMYDVESAEAFGATANNIYFPDCVDDSPNLFDSKQCWVGYFNACWCVDQNTGDAITMPSEDDPTCAPLEVTVDKDVTWCRVITSLVESYFKAFRSIKNDVEFSPDLVAELRCNKHGMFEKTQCMGGVCWCVDHHTGFTTRNNDPECQLDHIRQKRRAWKLCQHDKGYQFEAYYYFIVNGVMLEHFTIPNCNEQGEWDLLQCSNQTAEREEDKVCWCVDPVSGDPTTLSSRELKSCSSCKAKQLYAEKNDEFGFTPTCDETGIKYIPVQCEPPTGTDEMASCWCVDENTGKYKFMIDDDVDAESCEQSEPSQVIW